MRPYVLSTVAGLAMLVAFALAGPDAQAGDVAGCSGLTAGCSGEYAAASCAGDYGSYRAHRARGFRPVRGFFRACGKVAAAPFRGFRRHHAASYSYEYHETGNVNAGVSARVSAGPRKVCRNGRCFYVD
jgi:hypothetical protein